MSAEATATSDPHRYGFLWVTATPTVQGYFQWYFDGCRGDWRVKRH
jgi:hypothetical protein